MNDEILKTELIGKHVEITKANNKKIEGLKGTIINETKNTITVETNNEEKTLIKDTITLKMKHNNKTFEINGKLLVNKPEDRIKKVRTLQ